MQKFKKRPHFGEQRSKITVNLRVNHLRFFVNDFFLKNSYYCVYFEGYKRNKVKTQRLTKSLESLTAEEGLHLDGKLTCSMTMFQDDIHRKYMDGKLKAKYKRIVVRQMTKLRSGEILYRDIGYVHLPLHKIIQEPDLFDTRLVMTHPANAIDAYMDVTIDAKVDGFMSSMPTSLDTPRSVLKSVQSGFNVFGLGTPVAKNRFISIESQYFGESPAGPTTINLHNLNANNFSIESIPVDQITPMSESNKSFFFSFWSKKNRPYNAGSRADSEGVVIIEEPKKAVHFAGSDTLLRHQRSTTVTIHSVSGVTSDEDIDDNEIGQFKSEEKEQEEERDRPVVLKRKGTAMIRRDFSTEKDDDEEEEEEDDIDSNNRNENNESRDGDNEKEEGSNSSRKLSGIDSVVIEKKVKEDQKEEIDVLESIEPEAEQNMNKGERGAADREETAV